MKIKVGDKAKVITGANKGKEGKVLHILKSDNRVILEGVNLVKKHIKPGAGSETGGIIETEAPIHISNVKVLKSETKKATKAKKTTKSSVKEDAKESKK